MAERPTLPPIPKGMRAELTHDGVRWVVRSSAQAWSTGVGLVSLLAAALATGWLGIGGTPLVAWVPFLLLVPVVWQLSRTTTVEVTDRAVVVERRAGFVREQERFPLDEVSVRVIEPHEASGDWLMVVRAGDDGATLGRGQPSHHLAWMVEAIDVGRAGFAARERAEGREYSFLRKAPEALEQLRGTEPRDRE